MADFLCTFVDPATYPGQTWIHFVPLADPIDFGAVIMPLTSVGDIAPPFLDEDPVVPGPVGKDDVIELYVEDIASRLSTVVIMAFWPGVHDVIYDGENFSEGYSDSSVVYAPPLPSTPVNATFMLRRNLGWPVPLPPGEQLIIRVRAVDLSGQKT